MFIYWLNNLNMGGGSSGPPPPITPVTLDPYQTLPVTDRAAITLEPKRTVVAPN